MPVLIALVALFSFTFLPHVASDVMAQTKIKPVVIGQIEGKWDQTVDTFYYHPYLGSPLSVSLETNDGNWEKTSVVPIPLAHPYVANLKIADFNNDGFLDSIFLYGTKENDYDRIAIAYNIGDGTFTFPFDFKLPANIRVKDFVVGDIDGNGFPDVIVSPDDLLQLLPYAVYFNDGTGNFTRQEFDFFSYSNALALEDLTGDGLKDLVVVTNGSSEGYGFYLTILINNGTTLTKDNKFSWDGFDGPYLYIYLSPLTPYDRSFNGISFFGNSPNFSAANIVFKSFSTASVVNLFDGIVEKLASTTMTQSWEYGVLSGYILGHPHITDADRDGALELFYADSTSIIADNPMCEFRVKSLSRQGVVDTVMPVCGQNYVVKDFSGDGIADIAIFDPTLVPGDEPANRRVLLKGDGKGVFNPARLPRVTSDIRHLQDAKYASLQTQHPFFDIYAVVGNKVVKVDQTGRFLISNLPAGTYDLKIIKGGNLIEQSTITTKKDTVYNVTFSINFSKIPQNSSSTPSHGTIYTLWNSFLNMTNILELINPSDKENVATVEMFSISGERVYQQKITLAPGKQFDLILNDLPGFQKESYGIIKVKHTHSLQGRVTYYRQSDPTSYDYAFAVPFVAPTVGETFAAFNTYNPSLDSAESGNIVYNWLSIVNLASKAKKFTVEKYDQAGNLLSKVNYTVPAFGRTDIDGGHENPGPKAVGLNKIIPADSAAPYIAQLIRYGANVPAGMAPSGYSFAFALSAKNPIDKTFYAPLSNQFKEENWVELVNLTKKAAVANVVIYDTSGKVVHNQDYALEPLAQSHIFATQFVDSETVATIKVTPKAGAKILANSMFYYRRENGLMASMHGSSESFATSSNTTGSYNLFLGMENWLRVFNPSNKEVEFSLDSQNGAVTFKLPPHGTTSFPIHSTETYGTEVNSYGVLQLEANDFNPVIAELVRLRRLDSGYVDFTIPTAVN